VHAMHDPTEGGIATGLWEMAVASDAAIAVDVGSVPILPECRRLCAHFGIEPLGLIASGALLIAVAEGDAATAIAACESAGVTCTRIATVCEGAPTIYAQETGEQLPRYDQDEVTRVL